MWIKLMYSRRKRVWPVTIKQARSTRNLQWGGCFENVNSRLNGFCLGIGTVWCLKLGVDQKKTNKGLHSDLDRFCVRNEMRGLKKIGVYPTWGRFKSVAKVDTFSMPMRGAIFATKYRT